MKTLYIECNMGAAGDMLMAALSDLLPDPDAFIARMNALGLPGVHLERRDAQKCGITGTHISVTVDGEEEHSHDVHDHEHESREQGTGNREQEMPGHSHDHDHPHDHEHPHDHDHTHHHDNSTLHTPHSTLANNSTLHTPHSTLSDNSTLHTPLSTLDNHSTLHHHHHTSLADVRDIISGLPLPEPVKSDANAVYALIASAEARVHGHPIDQIHFHEVGTLDAVADVVGVCLLMHEIAPQRVVVSPVHVGCGEVRCAHGVLPVPAPATAMLLEGVPVYGGAIRGELCTPTGAALLKHFADAFGDMPVMALQSMGCGMGTKDFEWANCLRVMLGESADAPDAAVELRCNLDDMTGEEIGFAVDLLREAGALDVWTQAIQMKKGRPGTLLALLCPPEREGEFAELMLRHTTTIGVRCQTLRRYTLEREPLTLDTPHGPVRAKRSFGFGVDRTKPEFDDLAEIARREGVSVRNVKL